jgi:phage terminase small subunit
MTPRQRRFVADSPVDRDAARAGGGARSARRQGARLLKDEAVAEAVREGAEAPVEPAEVDAAWVLRKAVALHEKAMEAESFAVAKSALDLIGKHVAVQAFREGDGASLAGLSDAELEERIALLTGGSYVPRLA